MEVKNNPAARLHELLKQAAAQPQNRRTREALAAVFGVEADDTQTLLRMLASLLDLAEETKEEILKLDDVNHALHLRPFTAIDQLFTRLNLEAGWNEIRPRIDDTTLYGLEVTADKLGRVSGFTNIPEEKIDEIRAQITELHESVLASSLPDELRHLMVRNLSGLRYALDVYRIRGIDGIQEEIERSLGSIVLHRQQIEDTPEEQKPFWKNFFGLLRTINEVIGSARNVHALTPKIMEYLPGLVK